MAWERFIFIRWIIKYIVQHYEVQRSFSCPANLLSDAFSEATSVLLNKKRLLHYWILLLGASEVSGVILAVVFILGDESFRLSRLALSSRDNDMSPVCFHRFWSRDRETSNIRWCLKGKGRIRNYNLLVRNTLLLWIIVLPIQHFFLTLTKLLGLERFQERQLNRKTHRS